jgi:hypothetical protein
LTTFQVFGREEVPLPRRYPDSFGHDHPEELENEIGTKILPANSGIEKTRIIVCLSAEVLERTSGTKVVSSDVGETSCVGRRLAKVLARCCREEELQSRSQTDRPCSG